MTVQNKIYEGLAMRKPVITGESRAVRRAFQHGTHLYLCERANPQSIADAISALRASSEKRDELAEQGYQLYNREFDLRHNGLRFASHLIGLVDR
jgi:glycosyltransferase involved in cell wall biosynthesis